MRPGFDPLADRYRVIYPDLRGSGRTALGDPAMLTVSGAVADLEGLCDAMGLERVNVAGHSASAIQALIWAAEHPNRIASLVLVDPAPPFIPELAEQLWTEMAHRRTPEDEEEQARIMASEGFGNREPKTVEAFIRSRYLSFFRSRREAEALDFGFTEITAANVLEAEEIMIASLEEHGPLEALTRIQAPTLVIEGQLDPTPEELSRLLVDNMAGAQHAVIEGASHFSFWDEPGPFQEAVRSFLDANGR